MKAVVFKVRNSLCGECSMALKRFIGGLDGVHSIDEEKGAIKIQFNEKEIGEAKLSNIVKDSIERLGYGVEAQKE